MGHALLPVLGMKGGCWPWTSLHFVIKFPYNAHSDWLKQRALSENKARVDDGKLAFEFVIRNFDKFNPGPN